MSDKVCSQCGAICRSTARFCNRCSHPLSSDSEKRHCERGHRLDPSWTECPFCKASGSQTNPLFGEGPPKPRSTTPIKPPPIHTMVELDNQPPSATKPKPPKPSKPQKKQPPQAQRVQRPPTQIDDNGVMRVKGTRDSRTMVIPEPTTQRRSKPQQSRPQHPSQTGPIRAVLVTFSQNPNGKPYLIREGRQLLGSAAQAQLRVNHPSVSEKHAIITAGKEGIFIVDCLSTNGTLVNQEPAHDKLRLNSGDIIKTGKLIWRFVIIEHPEEGTA